MRGPYNKTTARYIIWRRRIDECCVPLAQKTSKNGQRIQRFYSNRSLESLKDVIIRAYQEIRLIQLLWSDHGPTGNTFFFVVYFTWSLSTLSLIHILDSFWFFCAHHHGNSAQWLRETENISIYGNASSLHMDCAFTRDDVVHKHWLHANESMKVAVVTIHNNYLVQVLGLNYRRHNAAWVSEIVLLQVTSGINIR